MNTYSERSYRKIYKKHYGPIPVDHNGKTYEIHHIDGNHANCDPLNLKAVTLQEHYDIHYAQKDWGACIVMADRMKLSQAEKSDLARKNANNMVINKNHPFLTKADGTNIQTDRVKDGSHHLLTRADGSNIQTDRIAKGEHNFIGDENPIFTMIKNGTHPGNTKVSCLQCRGIYSLSPFTRWHGVNCKINTIA
jgi:hypothetical protein